MNAEEIGKEIKKIGINTVIGVPDSTLKEWSAYLDARGKDLFEHYIPVNEGAAIGLAIGKYLATREPACVYMQNSGLGNAVNPLTSLAHKEIYGIPILLLVGWRGKPGETDEPQHKFMGAITEELLHLLEIPYMVLEPDMSNEDLASIFVKAQEVLKQNKQFAIIVRRGVLEGDSDVAYNNNYELVREDAIREILSFVEPDDIVVSTTGKISRELYEQRSLLGKQSANFMTVGGMGHASMIAYGIASMQKHKRVWCLDGDGAILMHMGSLAFIGQQNPQNLVHICMNNGAYESVGGMPTCVPDLDMSSFAENCGYIFTKQIITIDQLKSCLNMLTQESKLAFVEIKVNMSSRDTLGRPKERAIENKQTFMNQICL